MSQNLQKLYHVQNYSGDSGDIYMFNINKQESWKGDNKLKHYGWRLLWFATFLDEKAFQRST